MKYLLLFIVAVGFCFSCSRNPLKVDLSGVNSRDLEISSLDSALWKMKGAEDWVTVKANFHRFLPVFMNDMIHIGLPEDSDAFEKINTFVKDTFICKLLLKTDSVVNRNKLRDELHQAFRYFRYYFPNQTFPHIYTCISGFNQSVIYSSNYIGISLDDYLGADCPFYDELGLPQYKIRNRYPERILPDVMQAWSMALFPYKGRSSDLIRQMIYHGQQLYFVDAMMPELSDTVKMGYTKKQLEFCKAREAQMWNYLIEYKQLFSTDRMTIKRYIDDAPHTSSFSTDSPGRTGVWLGWQIVRSYMKNHAEVSLNQLMNDSDYMKILNQSAYAPE